MTNQLIQTSAVHCSVCKRIFASATDLQKHWKGKRRTSAAHGLNPDGSPRRITPAKPAE